MLSNVTLNIQVLNCLNCNQCLKCHKSPRLSCNTLPIAENTIHNAEAEMEKRADGADASVLIFSLCCANFLAVNGKIAKTFDFSTVLFFA